MRKLFQDLVSSDEDTKIDKRAIVCDESDDDILPLKPIYCLIILKNWTEVQNREITF